MELQDINQLTPEMNKSYYDLINTFYKASSIPLVLNTSFNGPGEPIVETPLDAIKSYVKNGLPVLVLENVVIEKKDYRIH